MKTVCLMPYCPLPLDTGSKKEMWKHLHILRQLGTCKIATARRRPVGMGWSEEYVRYVRELGFEVVFREDTSGARIGQLLGFFYGLVGKACRFDKAFGHSNPYHRYAFPPSWWYELTKQADIALINYSYWAWLPCDCPKVLILHDLLSNYMWEGPDRETREIGGSDLVVVISREEEDLLNQRGVKQTVWSPPLVGAMNLPLSPEVGIIGSGNTFNVEGLRWLENASPDNNLPISVFGKLARHIRAPQFISRGTYQENDQPFRECGIILMTTAGGMGMQIKAVEALAAGRAIIARRGAMRGLPSGQGAWIEVSEAQEMLDWAKKLQYDKQAREDLASKARGYYQQHLESVRIEQSLHDAFANLARKNL